MFRILKKIRGEKHQDKSSPTAKTERLKKVEVAKAELEKAKTAESTIAGPAYDLFSKLLHVLGACWGTEELGWNE